MVTNNKHINLLEEFLKIKSISTQPEYNQEMARARKFLVDLLEGLNFKTKVLKGKRHDAVFAQKITDPKLSTVLIYGHYDVQPADPLDQWKTSAFEPTIKQNKIYARGATDDKGQIMVHLMAVKNLVEKYGDKLPLNFKFIIEGEEEIGSISVNSWAKKYSKDLFKCDYIIVSDGAMHKPKHPSIETSLRGLVYAEIFLEAAKQDLHSGQFGGVAENPAIILSHIISQLKDQDHIVKITKFYDDVILPSKEELLDYQSLKTTGEQIIKDGQLFGIGGGEKKYSLNERRWSRPTLDVNGITSGYSGEGSKTIIPSKASAKISMRLVPNQDPDKIYNQFVKFVTTLVPKNIKVKIIKHASAWPYKAPTKHYIYGIIKKGLAKSFGNPAVFLGVGGSIGFVPIVTSALNVPCILVGFGLPDENLHSPNEHFSLDNYNKGIDAMVNFYQNLNSPNRYHIL